MDKSEVYKFSILHARGNWVAMMTRMVAVIAIAVSLAVGTETGQTTMVTARKTPNGESSKRTTTSWIKFENDARTSTSRCQIGGSPRPALLSL
jgi:hypothetical protein